MADPGNPRASVATVLRNRIMVSYALCAIAESQVHAEEFQNAISTVKAVRALIGEIVSLLADPQCLSTSAIREAAEMLSEIEGKTMAMELAIPAHLRPV